MSGPLYVPVLPAKSHAREAYRKLIPEVQSAVVPLWNLPPRPGRRPDELISGVRGDVLDVSKAQRHHPAWVDSPFADEAQLSVLAKVLADLAEMGPLRPVTGPERPAGHQAATLETARCAGNGLAIRVRVPGEWDDVVSHAVRGLVARVDPAVEADLLLDLGAVRADRPDAAKEALRALDALMPLAPWRTAAVLSGGFPGVTAELVELGTAVEPRWDWLAWRELASATREFLPRLTYGDYGIDSPHGIARGPSSGSGGPSWGVLRYTTDESFVLAKVPTQGDGRAAVIRDAARELLALPDFRGATASAGETWLRDCAGGRGPEGTGNFAVWLRMGNIQHMTYLVRSLRA
ncbi:beta family protein [Streptomyces catenulae]|uniref:Beta family protein n=1 Tax=Streptomyces catenulae TaxID=66875 RepID=A0ABV2YZI6_9ACTN|nr:beta family protein [Streptomyces catenulae]